MKNLDKFIQKELKHVSRGTPREYNGKYISLPIIVEGKSLVEGVLCTRYGGRGYLVSPSPQIGCPVRCKFCDMSDLEYDGNVSAETILEQISIILRTGIEYGYNIKNKPLKVSFVKGGEVLMTPDFPKTLDLIAEELELPLKVSTTFPDLALTHKNYAYLEDFANSYPANIQMQISLISTSQEFRERMTGLHLIPFKKLRTYGESWKSKVPNARKMTLSFTLTNETPCNPEDILEILSPEYFAVRIRDWIETNPGKEANLNEVSQEKSDLVRKKFEDKGYLIIPGKPGSTERNFHLTAGNLIKKIRDRKGLAENQ